MKGLKRVVSTAELTIIREAARVKASKVRRWDPGDDTIVLLIKEDVQDFLVGAVRDQVELVAGQKLVKKWTLVRLQEELYIRTNGRWGRSPPTLWGTPQRSVGFFENPTGFI